MHAPCKRKWATAVLNKVLKILTKQAVTIISSSFRSLPLFKRNIIKYSLMPFSQNQYIIPIDFIDQLVLKRLYSLEI